MNPTGSLRKGNIKGKQGNTGKTEKMTSKGLKNTLKYPLGIPIGFPGKPGSLGFQLDWGIGEKQRKNNGK